MHLNLVNGLALLCFDETCMEHLCLIQSLLIIFLGFYVYHVAYVIKTIKKERLVCKVVLDRICLGLLEAGHSRRIALPIA